MRIAEAQLVRAIGELEKAGGLSVHELAQAVKQFLARKRLGKRAGKIVRALEQYEEKETGMIAVKATTAHSLSPAVQEIMSKKAETLFAPGKEKVKMSFHEDPKLLGGVRLETTDTRYDFSLTRTLNQFRKSLCK